MSIPGMVPIPYEYFRELPEGAAILMAYLENQSMADLTYLRMYMSERKYQTEENRILLKYMTSGWFPFGSEKIKEDIGMSSGRQAKFFRYLHQRGLVQTKRIGIPAVRYVNMNHPQFRG